jgi:WD40 repeat protein/tRNA A-37 threonylcarbamoyl transferase component Bud32
VSDDPRVGTELAGYRIESLLGWGGMSVVYLAEDLRLKRRVALKLLATRLAEDESFRGRFLRESELAASIDHPNIVPIYEAGATEGVLFIAMRYVEGRDLKERLRRRRLDPGEAIGIIAQVASALDAAHARGLVHRDVKPSNVLLDPGARPDGSDHVYLADFGLTRRVSEETGTDGEAHLMGTIDYVAPEQIAGNDIDGRADVYSLGCLLFECLVGQPPFRRDSDLAVVFAHLEAEAPAASGQRPELPAALDAVIATALAKEPAERYPSCRELARAALAVAADEASERLVDLASRAAAGRSDLSEVEAELAGKVTDLQLVREQARALSATPTPTRLAAQGICPFKGLASFEPADADYFFGRERLVAELVARLVGAGFLGIVGPSGSGKSSVLRAGLLPALAGGVLPGSEGWRRLLLRPGERPLDELRRVLVSGANDPLAEALDALPANQRLLLAVDQLEELFTACQSDGERAGFADTLARAAADPDRRAVVVVALRADFYGRFAAHPGLAELLGANQVLVGPMQASELRRAVELPAARVGLRVEPQLADALVDDVEGEPGALPLLSTALFELWQKRQDNTLTLAAYRESGGVHGAVARLAEGTYARIPDGHRQLVRAIMLRLVGEGEGDAPVRRRAPLAELDLERNEDAAEVLATLAESRLVTVGEGSVEVAHEALLSEWPRLREWIEEDADGRRLRRHITQAATEWDATGRDQGELYRGARLAAALDWSADHALDLNELERTFMTKSREASEQETRRARRTNRRLRALLAGVAVLLAAAVAGGTFAEIERGEAREAETAQLAQRLGAQALLEENLDLSLLLARQATAIADSVQTRGYLFAALLRSPKAIGIMHSPHGALLGGIALSPDGRTLAVGDVANGKLLFFDARTYEPIGERLLRAYGYPSIAYSPDGETLAYGSARGVGLIHARTRKQLAEASLEGQGQATRMAFTKDGSRLVLMTQHASIYIRDAGTLRPVGVPIRPEGFTASSLSYHGPPHFALTADGRSLVTASETGELTWWDLQSQRKTRTLEIAAGYHALALSPDGRTAVVGLDGGIQLVDVRTGDERTARAGFTGSPNWLLFSPDGETVVSANQDGTVTLWDVGLATPTETLRGHSIDVQQPVFSSDGKTLYTVSVDGTAIAWDVAGNRGVKRPFTFAHDRDLGGAEGRFSPDGRLIAVGLEGKGIALWDARDLTPSGAPLLETGGEVKALAFSPDGRTLAAVARGWPLTVLTVWDLASRSQRRESTSVEGFQFELSPDGTRLATWASRPGGRVALWDVGTGAALGTIGESSFVNDVAFGGNGALVAFVDVPPPHGVSPAGPVPRVEVWDVAKGSRVARVQGGAERDALSVALSPDGGLLAMGLGIPGLVRLWDVRTENVVHTLDGGAATGALEFSSDGGILAVAADTSASLWDVATGIRIGPSLATGSSPTRLDLSSDGRRLLTTNGDGTGAVWDVDPKSWARRACAIANRTLTREEWERFLPGRPYEPACAT